MSRKFYPSKPVNPGTLLDKSSPLLFEAKRPITMERIETKVKKIKTVPARFTNLVPNNVVTTRAASIRKLKNLILKAIGPKLNEAAT